MHPPRTRREITFWDLVRLMWEGWRVVAAVVVAWMLLGGAAAFLITPVFRAEVLLVPAGEESGIGLLLGKELGMLRDIAGLTPQGTEFSSEAIATLRSRALTEQFVKDRNLLPVLFDDMWDAETGKWAVEDPSDVPTLWDACEKFDKEVRTVDEDKRTGLVTLKIEWTDPAIAAEWANELARRVNALLRQRALERATRNVEYLQREAAGTSVVELQQAISRLLESQLKQLMLARVNDEYAFKVIDAAVPPERAARPRRMLLIGSSIALGFVSAALFIWSATSMRRQGAVLSEQ